MPGVADRATTAIAGTLKSVDQCVCLPAHTWAPCSPPGRFLNIKLDNIRVIDEERYPHMVRLASACDASTTWR